LKLLPHLENYFPGDLQKEDLYMLWNLTRFLAVTSPKLQSPVEKTSPDCARLHQRHSPRTPPDLRLGSVTSCGKTRTDLQHMQVNSHIVQFINLKLISFVSQIQALQMCPLAISSYRASDNLKYDIFICG
jgi:hypothetical protein